MLDASDEVVVTVNIGDMSYKWLWSNWRHIPVMDGEDGVQSVNKPVVRNPVRPVTYWILGG